MKRRALFLDRDGVVNLDRNYVHRAGDVHFTEGVFETCRAFREAGYLVVVITNQSGIGRGYFTEEDFHRLSAWMREEFEGRGAALDGIYFCPHHPEEGLGRYRTHCQCRKPAPGMLLEAADDLDIDLRGSVLVGDKDSDIEAGLRAGVGRNYLLKTAAGAEGEGRGATKSIESLGDLLKERELFDK
jgi:D-glycero-D-manno-heptose 1,7-bisphosphate phosphatase